MKLLRSLLSSFGQHKVKDESGIVPIPVRSQSSLNLNVGAGKHTIKDFISLDYYSEHYCPGRSDFEETRVHFDVRSDVLRYEDETVDNIYLSHVIEHVETEYVEKFFFEALRVLKRSGIFRVACPDAEFLYQVSRFENSYWSWRTPSLSKSGN